MPTEETQKLPGAADREPMPTRNGYPEIVDLVQSDLLSIFGSVYWRQTVLKRVREDLNARRAKGVLEYGTALQPFNGRNAMNDLYQEILDAAQYARQVTYENDGVAVRSIYRRILELTADVAALRQKQDVTAAKERP